MSHSLKVAALTVATLAVGAAGCGDDATDPNVLGDFAEAEAVARSAALLPSLADLMDAARATTTADRAALDQARELWVAGVAADGRTELGARRSAALLAAPVLGRGLEPDSWLDARARAEQWIRTVEPMLRRMPIPAVEARIDAARAELDRADSATDAETGVYHLVMALAELVETTPRHVARTLAGDARDAVRRAEADPESGRENALALERARRLADWAVRAVEEEDYVRAIPRAYYALQLVEGR